uniref:Lysozyme inhibitor LprI-like N-terminal domain-containing protein n=1 Tax=uncultured Acidobacteriota bacterium TaxID=171953 RepID=Q7X2U5_9BACT|nr:hypothetical protein [uncultured Acidobacteriota bacterium]
MIATATRKARELISRTSLRSHRLFVFVGAVVMFVLVVPSIVLPFSDATTRQTQLQLNEEACAEYKKADAEMNNVYRRIMKDYRNDAPFIAALKKAQLAWIRYRDADLESIFPGDARSYGSINPMCRCMHLADTTKQRTKVLQQWIDGVEEGDVCAGSVRVK